MVDNQNKSASEQVIDILDEEKRANPLLIRERTGLKKQRVNRILNRLRANGRVTKVTTGLYEIDYSPDSSIAGNPEDVDSITESKSDCGHTISNEIDPDELKFSNQ
jgi:transcription initiation factor IIE alpha subunit